MNCSQIFFSAHSLKATINRNIYVDEVNEVIIHGDVIMSYENDKPYPNKLLLKFVNNRPIPDPNLWYADFKRKIK